MLLSKRLTAVAALVPPCRVLADIGADRGELSYYLMEKSLVNKIILSDVSPNSLARAKELFQGTPFEQQCDFRQGDGFKILSPGEAETAVLAGMGGYTISKILEQGKDVVKALNTIVVQAMGNSPQTRLWFQNNGLKITGEKLVWEDKHYYTIIQAQPGTMSLNIQELYAGPLLLAEKNPLLRELIFKEKQEKENILRDLKNNDAGVKRQEILNGEINFLKDILTHL